MKYTSFHEEQFRQSVNKALLQVQYLLQQERSGTSITTATTTTTGTTSSSSTTTIGLLGSNNSNSSNHHNHQYDSSSSSSNYCYNDKYTIVEMMTNMMIASIMNVFTIQVTQNDDTNNNNKEEEEDMEEDEDNSNNNNVLGFDLQPSQLQLLLSWIHEGGITTSTSTTTTTTMDDSKDNVHKQQQESNTTTATNNKNNTNMNNTNIITLRFIAEDTCTLIKEEEIQIMDPIFNTTTTTTTNDDREYITTTSSSSHSSNNKMKNQQQYQNESQQDDSGGTVFTNNNNNTTSTTTSTTTKIIQRTKVYYWKIGIKYKIILLKGTGTTMNYNSSDNNNNVIILQDRIIESIIVTQQQGKGGNNNNNNNSMKLKSPIPPHTIHPPIDTYSLSHLFQYIDPNLHSTTFTIDRSCSNQDNNNNNTTTNNYCATPRRNTNIDTIIYHIQQLYDWTNIVYKYFLQRMEKEIGSLHNPLSSSSLLQQQQQQYTTTMTPNIPSSTTTTTSSTSNIGPPPPNKRTTTATTSNSSSTSNNNNNNNTIHPPGTLGIMFGLTKEPNFNGKQIRIVEYIEHQQRYKAEPVLLSDHLPSTLSIKANNILVFSNSPTSSSTSSSSDHNRNNQQQRQPQQQQQQPMQSPPPPPPSSLSTINDDMILCPILPMIEGNNGTLLSMNDISILLQEHTRTMEQYIIHHLMKLYPKTSHVVSKKQLQQQQNSAIGSSLISISEACIVFICVHLQHIIELYYNSTQYIEDLLQEQLISAIGKYITTHDFMSYMKYYHYPKLYYSSYKPIPFTYPIRRSPNHYPDGIISIEYNNNNSTSTMYNTSNNTFDTNAYIPIDTWVRSIPGITSSSSGGGSGSGSSSSNIASSSSTSIYMPIDAAVSIELTGNRYLHGWMQHQFQSSNNNTNKSCEPMSNEYQCICRARQFSSYIVVLGTMSGPNSFEPKDAIIVQNKDEIVIPLLTTILPSAKEFKDAIQSLSPEQQEFAKSYRMMQLESSVFGICIIQIKPQLECLLGLPTNTLTKEIQLTQDIMSLFVNYQVPSDLFTYDGPSDTINNTDTSTTTTNQEKVMIVRNHVSAILKVIDDNKKQQLQEEAMRADMRAEMTFRGGDGSTFPKMMKLRFDTQEGSIPTDNQNVDPRSSIRHRRLAGGTNHPPPMMAAMAMSSSPGTLDLASTTTAAEGYVAHPPKQVKKKLMSNKSSTNLSNKSSLSTLQHHQQQPQGTSQSDLLDGSFRSTQSQQQQEFDVSKKSSSAISKSEDFTIIPKLLDTKLEQYDTDHSLHSTIIKAGTSWTRTRQLNLLTNAETTYLNGEEIRKEKKQAFALLDALSRSGSLPISCSELHVFIAVSHCFEKDVMGTIIQNNINPITKVERSSLLLSSTIYGKPIPSLIENDDDVDRLTEAFPTLLSDVQ